MNVTEIVWTEKTWNPMSGCHPVSPGCAHCYARKLAEDKRGTLAFPVGFDVVLKPHKLNEPHAMKKPALIFVNSMSDLFLDEIPDEYRDRVLRVIAETPRHTYQSLTKRPANAARYFATRKVPPNMWLGVTVEDQLRADERIPLLRQIDARVRFLSVEPMLSAIAFDSLDGMGWVIVGGESGSHLMRPDVCEQRALVDRTQSGKWAPRLSRVPWVRLVRDQCVAASVPFLFKQWGGSKGPIAGRELDGRIWDEYPIGFSRAA
jgi:protein gp37